MPITEERKSIDILERAGFTHDQAKAIVEVQEAAISRGFERFVEILDQKLGEMELRIRNEFQQQFQQLRTEMVQMGGQLRTEIAQLGGNLRGEISNVRADMAQIAGQLRTEMAQMKADLLRDQRDQMLKFAAIVSLIALVFGSVMKLFEFLKP
jgi:hypothetical protein